MSQSDPPKRGMITPPAVNSDKMRGKGHRSLKYAKKHTASSQKWLERQLNDPYVIKARVQGWRSRAAFKLLEINEKYKIIKKGSTIIDLGCAPGGWLQVLVKMGAEKIIGIDLLPVDPIENVDILLGDFTDKDQLEKLSLMVPNGVDLIVSDMAHNTIGHRETDHLKIMYLTDLAMIFSIEHLKPDGAFVCKTFQGGSSIEVLQRLKLNFTNVKHYKPKSSRTDSSELYLVATGFKGVQL